MASSEGPPANSVVSGLGEKGRDTLENSYEHSGAREGQLGLGLSPVLSLTCSMSSGAMYLSLNSSCLICKMQPAGL